MDALHNQKKLHDWHRADVVAALHKKGWSINMLAKVHGLSNSTLKAALARPYPKSERIIAEAIGVSPDVIWPERYAHRYLKARLMAQATQKSSVGEEL